jgi:hypothetical protein
MKRFSAASAVTAGLVLALSLSWGSHARADASGAAAAEALYEEGKKLETKGDFASACPKFAASQQLDAAAGTLLHLANCYEKTNKNASAWATYLDAASAAHAQNRADWEKAARGKAAALEPKLARVSILVTEATPGLVVKRDDLEVAAASFNVPIPLDAGKHTFTAEAPKKKPWKTQVDVTGDGSKVEVKIPRLEDVPATPTAAVTPPPKEPAPSTPPAKAEDPGAGRRVIGYTLGAVGIVGVGVGGVTGLMAIGANNDAKKLCPNAGPCADKTGVDDNDKAKTLGTVSTIGFVAGGVLIASGVVLVLTAPSSQEKKAAFSDVKIAPSFGPSYSGVSMGGSF